MAGNGNLYSMMYNELCMDVIEMVMKHLKKPHREDGYSPERIGIDFRLEYRDGSYDLYFKHRCNILQAIRKMDKPSKNINWNLTLCDNYNYEIYKIRRYYELSYQIYWLEALLIKFNSESAYEWIFNKVDVKNITEKCKKTKMNFKKKYGRIVESNSCYDRINNLKCWGLEDYVMTFGKHKTKTIKYIESHFGMSSYLKWCDEKGILDNKPALKLFYEILIKYHMNYFWSQKGYN